MHDHGDLRYARQRLGAAIDVHDIGLSRLGVIARVERLDYWDGEA
jgi:hypothetical protein